MNKEEIIEYEKEILINQINTGNGYYALFVLKTFKFINDVCKRNNTDWCLESRIPNFALIKYMYSSVYGGKSDHMAYQIAENTKKH